MCVCVKETEGKRPRLEVGVAQRVTDPGTSFERECVSVCVCERERECVCERVCV